MPLEDNNVSPTTESLQPDTSTDSRSNDDLDALADKEPRSAESPRELHDKTEAAPVKEIYEFVHNGKKIQGTKEQLIQWARQGYDYPQKAQKLNQDRFKYEQDLLKWEADKKKYEPYTKIDQWAAQNPHQWQTLQQHWQQTLQGGIPQQGQPQNFAAQAQFAPYIQKISQLEQQVQQALSMVQPIQSEFEQQKVAREDQALEQEIQSMKGQHKGFDWNGVDENGKTLERRIMEHAQATGIPTFTAAMRDLLHDQLMTQAQAQAQLSVAKGIQNRSKLGILGESSTPRSGQPSKPNKSIRETSYEELMDEVREELRSKRA